MKPGPKPKKTEYRVITSGGVTHLFPTLHEARQASHELILAGCDEVLSESANGNCYYRYVMGYSKPVYTKIIGFLP